MKKSMTRVNELLEKHPALFSLIMCGLPLIISLSFNLINIQIDDAWASVYAAGFNGSFEAYLPFNHFIYGHITKALFETLPGISWYLVIQITTIYLTFYISLFVILKYLKRLKIVAVLVLLHSIAYNGIYFFQFTQSAYICLGFSMFIAFVYLFLGNQAGKDKYYVLPLTSILALSGYMIRESVLYPTAFCLFCLLAFVLFQKIKNKSFNFSEILKSSRFACSFILISFMLLGFGYISQEYVISNNPIIKEARIQNSAKAKYIDYISPQYEDAKELYRSVNWTENDYKLSQIWDFNSDVFSADALTTVGNYRHGNVELSAKSTLNQLRDKTLIQFIGGFFLIMIAFVFVDYKNKRYYFCTLFLGMVITLLFLFNGRLLPRIITPIYEILIFFSIIVCSLYKENDYTGPFRKIIAMLKCKKSKIIAAALLCTIITLLPYPRQIVIKVLSNYNRTTDTYAVMDYVRENKDKLFITTHSLTSSFVYEVSNEAVLTVPPKGCAENIISLSGGNAGSVKFPSTLEKTQKHDAFSPYRTLLSRPEAYLIVKKANLNLYLTHLDEHYTTNYECNMIKDFDPYAVYEINEL